MHAYAKSTWKKELGNSLIQNKTILSLLDESRLAAKVAAAHERNHGAQAKPQRSAAAVVVGRDEAHNVGGIANVGLHERNIAEDLLENSNPTRTDVKRHQRRT